MNFKIIIPKIGKLILLIIASLFTVFPFIWMVLSALKTKAEVMDTSVFFPSVAQWDNFKEVLFNSPLMSYVGNSLFISIATVVLQVIFGSMLAYAIVFMNFRFKNILFIIVMATYMLPSAATYIPSYKILADLNLLDTYTGLIISCSVSIFGVFLLRQAFMQVPLGLVEAARIDGAGHFKILWKIICPITKSSFITFKHI